MPQKKYDVLAIGNALVDIICSVEEDFFAQHDIHKGSMTLVDEERADKIFAHMGQTRQISGGSAANTVAALSGMGGKTAFTGSVADDQIGKVFAHDIKAVGVDFFGFTHKNKKYSTGRCNIMVSPDAERTMCTYLGCAGLVPADALSKESIEASSVTYIEGYLWDQEETKKAIRHALEIVHNAGRYAALTLSDVFCVERHREDFKALIAESCDIIFANEDEIKSLYQVDDFDQALQECRQSGKLFALTRSAKGSVIVHGSKIHVVDAVPPKKLVDTTGAGDSFAAGFLYGLTQNMDYPTAARIGSAVASEVISHFGARAEVNLADLIAPLKAA
ncbi:MAG: adenosine kinase [Pseudomonadota bacterium]